MKYFLAFLVALVWGSSLVAADLEFEVQGTRNNKGTLNFYLYHEKDAASFLKDGFQGFVCKVYSPIQGGRATAACTNVPPGTYALSFFHDENSNTNFDLNWAGLPAEGYGFSNNFKPKLRAPKFNEVSFTVGSEPIRMSLECLY